MPIYFIISAVIISGTFLTFLSNYSMKFVFATLFNSFVTSNNLFFVYVVSLGFSVHRIMSSLSTDNFTSFFQSLCLLLNTLLELPWLEPPVQGEVEPTRRHPCLVSDHMEKGLSFYH